MNAPLYICYHGKKEIVLKKKKNRPCSEVFPANKRCERISDHTKKGCNATLTVKIVQCVRQK